MDLPAGTRFKTRSKKHLKKKALVYTNCQGDNIRHVLEKITRAGELFEFKYVANHQQIEFNRRVIPRREMERYDLILYQPVREEFGVHSTCGKPGTVFASLKPGVRMISFPYVYSTAMFTIFQSDRDVKNKEVVHDLLDRGVSPDEIHRMFRRMKMDFRFRERWDRDLALLSEKEKRCDIQVSGFLLENYRHVRLFHTHNHISAAFYLYLCNEILKLLELPPLRENPVDPLDTFEFVPTPYELTYHGFRFVREPAPAWWEFYRPYIDEAIRLHGKSVPDIWSIS